jgi:dihydrofolate reductase
VIRCRGDRDGNIGASSQSQSIRCREKRALTISPASNTLLSASGVSTDTITMRTVTFGAACSLDGFIARTNHAVDWLRWSKDVNAITRKLWKTIDTVVMGRKTFEVAVRSGGGAYPDVKNYVCSRTLKQADHPDVEIVADNAAPFVSNLKKSKGKGICIMGGGELASALFTADLIDEVGLNIHPVVLGSGIPMFPAVQRQIDLDLVESRQLEGGCVYVLYRVQRNRARLRKGSKRRRVFRTSA